MVAESFGNAGISKMMNGGIVVMEQHPVHTGKIMHNGGASHGCKLLPIQCKP